MQVQFQNTRSTRNGLLSILIWIYFLFGPFILTQDIPVHIYSGRIMRDLLFSGNSLYTQWFEWGTHILPNSFTQWASLFFSFWASPEWTHRFLILGMVSTAFSGSRSLLTALYPGREENASMILPFLMPVLFLKGFSNFFFGIGILLHLLSRIPEVLKGKPDKAFILLSLVLYTCHPLPFYLALIFAGFLIVSYQNTGETAAKITNQFRLQALLQLLPALAISLLDASPKQPLNWQRGDFSALWETLRSMQDWVWYHTMEAKVFQVLFISLSIVSLLSFIYTRKIISLGFTLTGIALLVFYFYAPSGASENLYIHARIVVLMSIFLSLGIALSDIPETLLRTLRYLSLAAFIFLLWYRYDTQSLVAQDWKQVKSTGAEIPEGAVVMPLIYSHQGNYSQQAGIFLHALPLVSESRKIVFLDNYSAHTSYFPIQWKPGKDPYKILGEQWEAQPPKPDSLGMQTLSITHAVSIYPPTEGNESWDIQSANRVAKLYKIR